MRPTGLANRPVSHPPVPTRAPVPAVMIPRPMPEPAIAKGLDKTENKAAKANKPRVLRRHDDVQDDVAAA